jgi:hypothetical protein
MNRYETQINQMHVPGMKGKRPKSEHVSKIITHCAKLLNNMCGKFIG